MSGQDPHDDNDNSSTRSLLCPFSPLDGIAEDDDDDDIGDNNPYDNNPYDNNPDDNDVDALMMRLPSPVTVEQELDGYSAAFGSDQLPPLRQTASLGQDEPTTTANSNTNGAFDDLRSRLISHDSWFLLFPNSNRNSNNGDNHSNGEQGTFRRSRSSDEVAQTATPSTLKTNDDDINDTTSDDASTSVSAEATPPSVASSRPPPTAPPLTSSRIRFATYDAAVSSPSGSQERKLLSSYDASSLRHRLERVSSSRQGTGRPVWALRRGSSLFLKSDVHTTNDVRPSYLQTLVLKKQLREHFADLQQDAPAAATDSAIAEELLRQVDSFEESASRLHESWHDQQPPDTREEGVEVMASKDDLENEVMVEESNRRRLSSTHSLKMQQQLDFLSPRDKDLQELAKQVLVENDVKELSHKLREIHDLVKP